MSEFAKTTAAMKHALEWISKHGGSCAIAKTANGGRIYLAQGETGNFMPSTVKKLIEVGKLEKRDGRIWIV
jgi:hypothetical protein